MINEREAKTKCSLTAGRQGSEGNLNWGLSLRRLGSLMSHAGQF